MKKLKKYTGIGLGIIAAPVVIYGVYKTNVAPELINNKNNSLFLSNPKQGLSFPRSSAKPSAKKSTALDLDITLKSAGNIEEKFQTMIGTSNITKGQSANIFEDSSGNLWSMGNGKPLQVLRKGATEWKAAGHNSNITDGYGGIIFEDSSGNLWSMGNNTPLQVLKKNVKKWEVASHGSNITSGAFGTIVEDSQGNLWSAGSNTPLQVLKKGETEWKGAEHGSKIIKGYYAVIYEDSTGNLWSMGHNTPLQVLKKGAAEWKDAEHKSKINNGVDATIFEDSNGNLWSMGFEAPLQVLRKGATEWEDAGHNSNITNGQSGTFFEDSFGNLWSMGKGTPLQVLRKGTTEWKGAGHNSNITNGESDAIFEDSSGNLWSMGVKTPLQVLKKGATNWEDAGHNSNITNGQSGTIFEDSSGNLWSKGVGTSLQVKPFGLENWINNRISPKPSIINSNIAKGHDAKIFEDSSGNLWSMGWGTPLQVLRKNATSWEGAGNGSNIINGLDGAIYEDSLGNLWSMGYGTPLQVLRKNAASWEDAGKNSNIVDGWGGAIFEDSSGNLWSIGHNTPLQVLRKGATEWEDAGHNSNITNGQSGTFFKDLSGNLWSMGKWTPLQVLRKGKTEWEPAGHNSNITKGYGGTIFEDSSGNLWSMGNNTPLQVLKKGATNWELAAHDSNITDGALGTIFEDSSGNLWSMGYNTPLQVLKKGATNWTSTVNSNITNGENGTIFEDSKGNLWSMGSGTPLQVLRKNATSWEEVGHSSNITNGETGTIFEDSSGNLWSMGNNTPLQVFKIINKLVSTKFSNKYNLSLKDNRFNLEGDLSDIKRKYFKLKYKLSTDKVWKDFDDKGISKDVITTGEYQFEWVINSSLELAPSSNAMPSIPNQIVINIKDITGTHIENKGVTSYIGANDGKITLPTTGLPKGVTIQVSKGGVEVADLDNLAPGTYDMKYALDTSKYDFISGTLPKLTSVVITESNLAGIDPTQITGKPIASKTTTSYIGANDGKITLPTTGLPTGVTIQVSKDGVEVTDLDNLKPGTYDMKYVLDTSKYVLKSGILPNLNSVDITESDITQINGTTVTVKLNLTKGTTSYIGANDGKINVPVLPDGVEFVVTKDGNVFSGTDFNNLEPGVYKFTYQLKSGFVLKTGTSLPNEVKLKIKESTLIGIDPTQITGKPIASKTTTSYIGANDGKITLPTTGLPTGVTIQVSKDGVKVTDLKHLSPGKYDMKYVLDTSKYVLKSGTLPNLNSVDITESDIIQIDGTTVTVKPTIDKDTTSFKGNNDGSITMPTLPEGVKLVVTKDGNAFNGTDFNNLEPGVYKFTYQLKSGFVLKTGTSLPNEVKLKIKESTLIGIDPTQITGKPIASKTTTSYIGANDGKITLPTTGLPTGVTIQVSKDGVKVTDLKHLSPGKYDMKYVLDTSKYVLKSGTLPNLNSVDITESDIIQIDGTTFTVKPTIDKDTTSFKGNNDGSITMPTLPEGVKLVVTKDGNAFNGTDFNNLEPGVYKFTYQLKSGFVLKIGTSLPNEVKLKIKESTLIGIDPTQITGKPIASKTTTSYIGANDGKITLPTTGLPTGVTIQVSKGGVKVTDIKHLSPGTYDMKYVLDTSKYVLTSGTLPNLVSVEIINPISNESKNKKSSNLKLIIYIISSISGVSLLSFFGYKIIKKIKNKY